MQFLVYYTLNINRCSTTHRLYYPNQREHLDLAVLTVLCPLVILRRWIQNVASVTVPRWAGLFYICIQILITFSFNHKAVFLGQSRPALWSPVALNISVSWEIIYAEWSNFYATCEWISCNIHWDHLPLSTSVVMVHWDTPGAVAIMATNVNEGLGWGWS